MAIAAPRVATLLVLCACFGHLQAQAQEIEPRAYSPSPTGVNFAVVSYVHSSGNVLTDPSLPFDDVEARLDAAAMAYGRTFGLFGRAASAALAAPYVRATISGSVGEDRGQIHRSGLADARLRLAVNLLGGPAQAPAQFARREPQTTLGASLSVIAPTGQYDSRKLINLGTNRWAFKPELGLSHPAGRWYFETYAGLWLFTANDDFAGGSRRSQQPMASLQGHVSYTIRPRLWLALDATYYAGGETTVDGVRKSNRQENSRVGVTLALPFGARHSFKLAWSDGASTRIGSDFSSIGVAWQYTWFDR